MFRNLFVWLILVVTVVAGLSQYTFNHTAQYNYGNTSKNEPIGYANQTRVDHRTEEIQLEDQDGEINSVAKSLEVEVSSNRNKTEAIETFLTGNRDDNFPESAIGCDVEVDTKGGPIRGYDFQLDPSICAYIDIPYGKIEGRFQAPLEADPWTEVHEEREHTKFCPQILNEDTIIDDENCLVLSIFTSKDIKDAPVLFYIHDGNFEEGSGDPAMFGPEFIVPRGVVLVLPNYRLGPLGYLCLRNSTAPGNAALKDLTLALRWVNDNIQEFGGDPTKITISGDGKAGALVSLLALSPQSRNLFTKAITESGSVLSPWAIDRDPVKKGLELGNMLCEDGDDECKTPYELLEEVPLSTLLRISFKNEFKFVPCIEMDTEEAFLTETPWRILTNNIMNITFLIGSADRSGMHEALKHNSETLEYLNKERESLLPVDLMFDDSKTRTEAANDITTLYFEDEDISEERKEELTKYYTDALYLGPSVRMARALVAAGATVYLYEFSYVGGLNRERNVLSTSVEGAARGDLTGYLFAQEEMVPNEQDDNMINFIMELWTSFMRTGGPVKAAIIILGSGVDVEEDQTLIEENVTAIVVKAGNCRIGVVPVYFERDMPIGLYLDRVRYACLKLRTDKIILGGDVNAWSVWWSNERDDARGVDLCDFLGAEGLCILNDGNTPAFEVYKEDRLFRSVVDVTACSSNLLD